MGIRMLSLQQRHALTERPAGAWREIAPRGLQAITQAISARSSKVLASATTPSDAPEPGQGSLNAVWGVATFAIIAVLMLAQLPNVREAFMLGASPTASPAAEVATAAEGPLDRSSAAAQDLLSPTAAAADPATAGAPSIATVEEDRPTATQAAPVEGSPEPMPAGAPSATATAAAPQPTATPAPAVAANAPLAPIETAVATLAPALLAPVVTAVATTVVTPVVNAVTTTVTTVTGAVTTTTTSTRPTATPTSTSTAKNNGGGGPTTTRAR